MRYPKPIHENATIGIVAPSFGIATEPYITNYYMSKCKLEELGFKIVECESLFILENAQSNSPQVRAQEFMDFYCDDEIDLLWACCGGELMCEMLPFIDFKRIKKSKPKWFIGFSDNTNLIHPLLTITDTASIYGMNFVEAFTLQCEEASYDLLNLLLAEKVDFRQYASLIIQTNQVEDFTMSGVLMGGCLDVLLNLVGTEYDNTDKFLKKYKGEVLLYIEAYDLNVLGLKRALWQFNELGWLKKIKGVIIGKMRYSDTLFGVSLSDVVHQLPQQIPVIFDVELGHIFPTMPFVNGGHVDVSVRNKELVMTYKLAK